MKWNAQGQEVADDDPTGIYDEKPVEVTEEKKPDSAAVLAAYQQQLQQEARERARLQTEIDELKKKPAPTEPVNEREFFDTPITSTRKMIQEEIAAATKPTNEFIQGINRQNTYNSFKQQMKDSGRFPYLAQIESLFDQAMNGINPTVETMTGAYNTALGFYISNGGELTKSAPASSEAPGAPPAAPRKPLPPHASPSAPPAKMPNNSGKTQVRALNANEKVIMRANGWTDPKEYLFYTEHVTNEELVKMTDEQIKARIKEIFG